MFLNETALLLLVLVPLAGLLLYWRERRRSIRLQRLGSPDLVRALAAHVQTRTRRWKALLWLTALAALVIALARPVWGVSSEVIETRGISLMFVLDVSASMDAEDVLPSRLERARLAARELMESAAGSEVGLILFAGTAVVQFPLTTDPASAVTFLNAASSRSITQQGTAVEDALRLALRSFDERISSQSAILLLSDGENHEGDPVRPAREAASRGIPIHVIGYGSAAGAPIPLRDAAGSVTGFKTDSTGAVIYTRLEETVLREIAAAGGGTYQTATPGAVEVVNLLNILEDMQGGPLESRAHTRQAERFGLFVLIALAALSLETLLREEKTNVA